MGGNKKTKTAKVFIVKEGTPINICGLSYKQIICLENFINHGKLTLVGCFTFENGDKIYGYPKYMDKCEADSKELGLIAETIIKLKDMGKNLDDTSPEFDSYSVKSESKRVDVVSLARFIVSDYISSGLYFRTQRVRTKACTGRISWNATVKKTSPIIDRDVIYSDVIRYTYHADYDGLLTNLHAHIVGQCIVLLQSTGRFANLQPPECNMPFSENLKQYAKPIRQNLSAVFTDREVNLFKAMAAWCDISPNYRELSATGCFQNVWEWVNDEVFGNQGSDQKNTDPPEYVLFGNCYKGTGEEKPDTIYSNKKYNIINIFDSKYYVPKFNGSDKKNMQVEGFPPNSDIAKQVGYYDSTRNANNGVRISNTFLVPLCSQIIEQFGEDNFPRGKLYYDIGYVKKGKMKSLTENKNSNEKNRHVNIMVVNPEKLYEKFLANEKISDEESNVIFDIYDGYGNTSTSED